MNKPSLRRAIYLLALVLANVGCDQVSKFVVRGSIEYGEQRELIGEYFIMTKVENTGAFLSAGADLPPVFRDILLVYLPLVVMVFLLVVLVRQKKYNFLTLIGMAFVLGGGIGNLIDRIAYGSVTDFLHIDLVAMRTGVFNFADMSIMLGLGIVIVGSLKKDPEESEPIPEEPSAG